MPQQTTIAVLPFQNNSPDEENAYFADGVHEDILTQLSKIADLTVISRTSVMRYRGASQTNLRQIGEELGATAILEGSVRRVGNEIRVTTQLIDVETDAHLWAEAYDRELENVFAVQSEIAQRVAEALRARLTPQVIARIARAPTMSLQAYDIVIRAREARLRFTEEANDEAIRLYDLALELDPEYTEALAGLANAYVNRPFRYRGDAAWLDTALVLAERAIQLDSGEAAGHKRTVTGIVRSKSRKKWSSVIRRLRTSASGRLGPPSWPETLRGWSNIWSKRTASRRIVLSNPSPMELP